LIDYLFRFRMTQPIEIHHNHIKSFYIATSLVGFFDITSFLEIINVMYRNME